MIHRLLLLSSCKRPRRWSKSSKAASQVKSSRCRYRLSAKGNSYNQEVIQEAKTQGMYVIGYLDDQAYMGRSSYFNKCDK